MIAELARPVSVWLAECSAVGLSLGRAESSFPAANIGFVSPRLAHKFDGDAGEAAPMRLLCEPAPELGIGFEMPQIGVGGQAVTADHIDQCLHASFRALHPRMKTRVKSVKRCSLHTQIHPRYRLIPRF